MPRTRRSTYDRVDIYTEPQLIAMYIKEGMTLQDAKIKAKFLHRELNTYAERESYFWKKVRANENTVGLDVETFLEGEEEYAS